MNCRMCKGEIEDVEPAIFMVHGMTLWRFCDLDCFGMFAFENADDDLTKIRSDA